MRWLTISSKRCVVVMAWCKHRRPSTSNLVANDRNLILQKTLSSVSITVVEKRHLGRLFFERWESYGRYRVAARQYQRRTRKRAWEPQPFSPPLSFHRTAQHHRQHRHPLTTIPQLYFELSSTQTRPSRPQAPIQHPPGSGLRISWVRLRGWRGFR
ncbi:hypothetical protein K443DRAFT_566369 [Laccaria amethystina LaAM-08-1]|uniref:Uncharacterized protein n=1 Tax=Laccaria amethystina LaAM-08-1 TaxID=1095629 RepID=A0A0C9WQZ2_9AGAR|nr:hypothetical protein K443DRAFT_566369 [Laccaria amethystina LaAM-08-1]